MKSRVLILFLALNVGAVAVAAGPPPAQPKLTKWQQHERESFKNSAPADEYFGRAKMSYLGINNTFRDASISSGRHTTDRSIANKVALADGALEAWARSFPRDPQLARSYFLATQVERKIWIKANQDRAWIYLNRLVHDFPQSYFGRQLKRDLAIGFTEHYYAQPLACATPTPSPSPSPEDMAATFAEPVPSASPAGAPTVTPSPGPTETTLSRGLRVQVIPQPCIVPPTPSPTPSPSPSPVPSPLTPAAVVSPGSPTATAPPASPSPTPS